MPNKIVTFFFGKKQKAGEEKVQELLLALVKNIPQFRAAIRAITDPTTTPDGSIGQMTDGAILGHLYDFYINSGGGMRDNMLFGAMVNPVNTQYTAVGGVMQFDYTAAPQAPAVWQEQVDQLPAVAAPTIQNGRVIDQDKRIVVKPIDVEQELHTPPIPVRMERLDTLIATFKDKTKLLYQTHAKAQIEGLITRLENRKHYKDYVDFFIKFPNTTNEKIDDLLKKYKLVINKSDLYVPSFPKEAIDVMKEYSEVVVKIAGEKPVFYVIAEVADFQKKAKQLDPILLVQSPFGFYWQILGAWDKEILILTEL